MAMPYDLIYVATDLDAGMTVKGALRRAKGLSARQIRRIIGGTGVHGEKPEAGGEGGVFLNDRPARFVDRVQAGDRIGLLYPREDTYLTPQEMPLNILYEDEDILAVDKPPGIVVHPTKGHPDGTLANGIVFRMRARCENYRPRFINRLDMGTSGIVLIGKNAHAQSRFTQMAAKGQVEKRYIAVCYGAPEPPAGVIDLPIGMADGSTVVRTVRADGAPSVTEYETLTTFALPDGTPVSALKLRLLTGRTHQIRVHLSHAGHAVVGDSLYGPPGRGDMDRQALHAVGLYFPHPNTGERIEVVSPLPPDMQALTGGAAAE
ncbi:MAG: RluA family pseudouridine synthase [Clostridiales Family XIII bacterium]|jgi:23S rRNA pseudouridine1911/1915/1917 synthase|nr:RluA family pseudouridine synthase [Clostridiales Family XIII bacterium]